MIQPVLQPQQPPKRQILTVSQLNNRVKGVLENQIASDSGMVINAHVSGIVHSVTVEKISDTQLKAVIKAEAGAYIKELISGDNR